MLRIARRSAAGIDSDVLVIPRPPLINSLNPSADLEPELAVATLPILWPLRRRTSKTSLVGAVSIKKKPSSIADLIPKRGKRVKTDQKFTNSEENLRCVAPLTD